jgi:methyltransferase (TIGR00027 family)
MKEAPSNTALLVARGVAFQSTHPRFGHLVPNDAGELARHFVAAAGRRVRSGSSRLDRLFVAAQERLTVPGITLHYVLRKRYIEELARAAIGDGFRQLVVLGAGFDTLALRLSHRVRAVEIDHPATQHLKRTIIDGAIEFVPADFTHETLALRDEPTLFVAEAVFLYLTEEQVRRVLAQIREVERARVIFTFWEPRDPVNFQNATPLADWWLRRAGEPGRWAIAPEKLADFLASEGFSLLRLARDDDYHHRYVSKEVPLAKGEHIAVACHP